MHRALNIQLDTEFVGNSIIYLQSVGSTNTYAKRCSSSVLSHGTVILADQQTHGRGTKRRKWVSTNNDIALTLVLDRSELRRVDGPPGPGTGSSLPSNQLHQARFVFLMSVAEALHELVGLEILISRNDIYVDDRKMGGVLIEEFQKGGHEWLAIGLGLNLNSRFNDFPPYLRDNLVTMREASNRKVDRSDVMNRVLSRFEQNYSQWQDKGFEVIRALAVRWLLTPYVNIHDIPQRTSIL